MGSSQSNKNFLHVSVYWGGAELGQYCRPLSRSGGVSAGRGVFCDIKSVIWPRWDELEIISKTKSGLVLNPNIPWDGVIGVGDHIHVLKSLRSSRKLFEIRPGTTASLRLDDMTIAIRVGPKFRTAKRTIQPASGYTASPLQLVADKSSEWISLAVATVAAGAIAFSAYTTLKSRDNDLYRGITELPSSNLYPFISQKHLIEAPNVMQFALDRFSYVHSVWNYYTSLAMIIGFGRPEGDPNLIFNSSVNNYKEMLTEQEAIFATAEAQQKADLRRHDGRHGGLSIPMVRGESLDGRIQRVLDKINIYSAASMELAKQRVEAAETFEKDIGFNKDAAKNEPPKNEAFEKITQGYLGIESDDKMQVSQARNAAARAALAQIDLFGEERLRFGAIDCCAPPVGAPLSQSGVVWLSPDVAGLGEIGSLAALKASVWGTPVEDKPVIREPVVGKIEASAVERAVNAGRYQLRLCYELALRRNQATKGSMEWRWQIDTRGIISNINLLHSSIKDEELVRCVHDKIATWKFPKPKGGTVEIRYPFEFSRDRG